MRKPAHPPALDQILPKISHERLEEIIANVSSPSVGERYLHWDKLRRKQPPDSLTHEEWWFGLKLARNALAKKLPLTNAAGRHFRYGTPDPIPRMLYEIHRRAGGSIVLPSPVATTELRDSYIVRSLMEEAITSSQIEGASTTRLVAKEMLRTGRAPRDRNERMIVNNFRTMEKIREWRDSPLTVEMLLALQAIATEDTLDDPTGTGRLRNEHENVVVADSYGEVLHVPPPASTLPQRLRALCEFANEADSTNFVDPVLRAIILHFWIAYDHPFVDGNGRCARSIFYWSMLRRGAWITEFISISEIIRRAQGRYGRAFLYCESDDSDVTYFLLYHLDVLTKALDQLYEHVRQKAKETAELEQRLRRMTTLNHRQQALLGYALRHAGTQFTIEAHKRSHGVVYQTARTDLLDLEQQGLLTSKKIGRTLVFDAVRDLEKKLGRPP